MARGGDKLGGLYGTREIQTKQAGSWWHYKGLIIAADPPEVVIQQNQDGDQQKVPNIPQNLEEGVLPDTYLPMNADEMENIDIVNIPFIDM